MFDFNKLDDYRKYMSDNKIIAMVFEIKDFRFELTINEDQKDYDLYIINLNYLDDKIGIYSHESFEDFKKKVADYFLNINLEVK